MNPGLNFWVMRHASSTPVDDAKDDDTRPLDKQGVLQAKAAGIALKKTSADVQSCLSSPMRRAMETAEIVCGYLGLNPAAEPRLAGSPVKVKDLLADQAPHCLLVSHAPLTNLMVYDQTGAQVSLAKGGLAEVHDGEIMTILNPSVCYVIAGMATFRDPAEVDLRSWDDQLLRQRKAARL